MVNLTSPLIPQVTGMPESELKIDSYGLFDVTDETVISYDEKGGVLSKYGDDIWRFETQRETLILRFNIDSDRIEESKKQQIKYDLKSLQLALLHTPSAQKVKVKLGFNRQASVHNALRLLVRIALEQGFDFKLFFTGNYNHYLEDVLTKRICAGLNHLLAAHVYFKSINIDLLETLIPLKKSFEVYVHSRYKELDLEKKQTLPIPERIYKLALEKIEQDLNDVDEDLLNDVISELKKNSQNPLYGLDSREEQIRIFKRKQRHEYQKVLEQNSWKVLPSGYDPGISNLDNALELQDVYQRLEGSLSYKNFRGLREYLVKIQKICFRALVAYSGGRLSDISYLTCNALVFHEVGGKSFPLLYGAVQKGAIIDDDVEFWVTNAIGQKAFNIARKISDFIYKTAVNKNFQGIPKEEKLLFASHKLSRKKSARHTAVKMGTAFSEMEIDGAVIDGGDYIELMRLDPSLDLEREDISEDSQWQFAAHQFRRTLAIYAIASGAVSLPSLRRQLRHLGESMTLYYSGGSCAASNIIEKKGSFAKECAETKSASTAIALHKFVASDERIFGGMGRHLDKNPQLKDIILNQDITETQKAVERGELYFDETALGGCGESGNCNYRPFALMDSSHCTDCGKAYHKLSVINKTIRTYEVSLNDIPLNTRQHKWRQLQIEELKQLRDSHLACQEKEDGK